MPSIEPYVPNFRNLFLYRISTLTLKIVLLLPAFAAATNLYEGISIPGWSPSTPVSVPSPRERRRGCYEVGGFHIRRPPIVNCSTPHQCRHPSRLALCGIERVRAYDTKCKRFDRRGRCTRLTKRRGWVNVCVRRCKSITEANGSGDPHFTTFQGHRFDFQGEGNKYYVVFSRSCGGDRLVTRMRSSRYKNDGIKATYFDAFGLTSRGCHTVLNQVLIETIMRNSSSESSELENAEKKWSVRVSINGEFVDSEGIISMCPTNEDGKGSTLLIAKEASQIVNVTITTADAKYRIRAKKLWKFTRHLDISIGLRHSPSARFVYGGLLGHTLNAAVNGHRHRTYDEADKENNHDYDWLMRRRRGGKRKKKTISKEEGANNVERAMRKKFETDSMFPDEAEEGEAVALVPVGRLSMAHDLSHDLSFKGSSMREDGNTEMTVPSIGSYIFASIVHETS